MTLAMCPSGLSPSPASMWPGHVEHEREGAEKHHKARETVQDGTVYSAASRCSVPGRDLVP